MWVGQKNLNFLEVQRRDQSRTKVVNKQTNKHCFGEYCTTTNFSLLLDELMRLINNIIQPSKINANKYTNTDKIKIYIS